MSCPSTVHETYGHVTCLLKQFHNCTYRQHHQNISMVILFLYKGSWWGTPHWGLQSSPNIHEHTYQKKDIVIDTKIVEIRKPQAELAETMCLCWHLPHLLQHRHMVTPPRAFVRFLTLPNYLSVTSLNCIITRSSFPHLFKNQRRSSSRPELIERVLCCTLLCCTLLY